MNLITEKKESLGLSHKDPFQANILELRRLNHAASEKMIYHLVLDLQGSSIQYEVGSCIGIYPKNDVKEIFHLCRLLRLSPTTPFYCERLERTLTVREFLYSHANLDKVTKKHGELASLDPEFTDLQQLDHVSLIEMNPDIADPIVYLNALLPLLPRYYSIASSKHRGPFRVELLIASVDYEKAGKEKKGALSRYLEEIDPESGTLDIFYLHNPRFTVPEDHGTPIIMIGPGTGLAAFRGFLQERVHQNASGKNWLFFGARKRLHDFYYQEELEEYIEAGKLILDTAFSRDQEEKIYVQHRMWENRHVLWQWITQHGAHLYICGDAKHMAKDVEAMLEKIAIDLQGFSPLEAKRFFKDLRKEKRMHLDVY